MKWDWLLMWANIPCAIRKYARSEYGTNISDCPQN